MHRLSIFLSLVLLPLLLPAQDLPLTEMTFAQPTYDFGTITSGEIVTHVFTFTNTGNEPLVLSDARGSCGCTVPSRPAGAIAPGETASVTVQFNSRNKSGMRNQKVTITANTEPAQTFLYLTGSVDLDPDWNLNDDSGTVTAAKTATTETPKDCFAIYPNPTAEVLKLRMDENNFGKSAEVVILSLSGQLMARRRVEAIVGDVEFDVSHYPGGTYHARVSVDGAKPESQCFVVVE